MNTLGSYEVYYSVQDAAGNEANITRTVNVINHAPTDLNLSTSSVWGKYAHWFFGQFICDLSIQMTRIMKSNIYLL